MTELDRVANLEVQACRLRRERIVLLTAVLVSNLGCVIASVARGPSLPAWSGVVAASVAALVLASRLRGYLRAIEREIRMRITAVPPRL